jgi:NAD+ kinase
MPKLEQSFKRIAIAAHPQLPEAVHLSGELCQALQRAGVQVVQGLLYDDSLRESIVNKQIDLLIALGGDGTMLRVGHLCGPVNIPILGINVGHFGFLIEIRNDQWRKMLPRLLAGDFWVEKRMMLCAERWGPAGMLGRWEVLNEIVVSRGLIVRPIHLATYVDERYLTTFVADALIASTATGSTAYALAAGGPILPPELRNILLVAVAPHLSIDRAIVLAEGSSVSFIVPDNPPTVLSPDGQAPIQLDAGDRVEVRASEHTAQFVRFQDPGYFYRNLTPHMNQNPAAGARR